MTMMPTLKVESIKTDDLVPYAGNAKEHPEWQVDQICNSIQEFGFDDPIAVWTNESGETVIVEGHGRLLAAKQLGIDTVPCIRLDHLDDEARRAYTLVHNQLTTNTGYDEDILSAELEALGDFDMAQFGFAEGETLEDYEHVEEDTPPQPDYKEPATVKLGQVWKLGEHRLMCGSSTDKASVSKLMGGVLADLMLTDPPYNCAYGDAKKDHAHRLIENDDMPDDQYDEFIFQFVSAGASVMKAGAAFYIWGDGNSVNVADNQVKRVSDLKGSQQIIWVKSSLVLGMKDYQSMHECCLYGWKLGAGHTFADTRTETSVIETVDLKKLTKGELIATIHELIDGGTPDVLRVDKPLKSELHPTMKPVKLFARLMRNSSNPGDIVYDAFGGSGTSIVAAEQMGRSAYVMELDPYYCDVIIERWEQLTGRKAELVSDEGGCE